MTLKVRICVATVAALVGAIAGMLAPPKGGYDPENMRVDPIVQCDANGAITCQ